MNKTVNINLGGMFFHIDEDAYQKLTRYFDAIKRSLSKSAGQEEIIKDIEMRIAEIVSEKHTHEKQVINMREVEEIITIMGQPEDYRLEDEQPETAARPAMEYTKRSRKLYRDTEKGMLGGVCSGLGHYFGIDAVWIRILFVILVFAGVGAGIVAYIVLWVVTPAAVTTSEKLEMTGEPVNISNIEKKVREEFENVSDKFKSADYDRVGKQVKTGVERAASNVGEVFSVVFKAFAKVLGAFLAVVAGFSLLGFFIALITFGSTSLFPMPWQPYVDAMNYTNLPLWVISVLGFLALAIPFFFLFLLGLKLLVNNMRSIGNIAKLTLLAVWLVALGILITMGIKQATEVAFDGKTVDKQNFEIAAQDTLHIKMRYNDFFAKETAPRHELLFTEDEQGKEQIYSNEISFEILRTDNAQPYIQIEKRAKGKTLAEARNRAEQIKYSYRIEKNELILDNYLLTNIANKYRDQEVKIFLYLPKGTLFKTDHSLEDYDESENDYFNLHYSGNYNYRVDQDKVRCLNCPADEVEEWDMAEPMEIEGDTAASLILNQDGVLIKRNKKLERKDIESVNINNDGIIIKTK